jgi:hypothetical protein
MGSRLRGCCGATTAAAARPSHHAQGMELHKILQQRGQCRRDKITRHFLYDPPSRLVLLFPPLRQQQHLPRRPGAGVSGYFRVGTVAASRSRAELRPPREGARTPGSPLACDLHLQASLRAAMSAQAEVPAPSWCMAAPVLSQNAQTRGSVLILHSHVLPAGFCPSDPQPNPEPYPSVLSVVDGLLCCLGPGLTAISDVRVACPPGLSCCRLNTGTPEQAGARLGWARGACCGRPACPRPCR